ncbi:hypothetical protein VPHD479_0356 [Vibrio phage D479]
MAIIITILERRCQKFLSEAWNHTESEVQDAFLESDPSRYHMGLGRAVRNECGLWRNAELLNEHPDDFSHRMLVQFKEKVIHVRTNRRSPRHQSVRTS